MSSYDYTLNLTKEQADYVKRAVDYYQAGVISDAVLDDIIKPILDQLKEPTKYTGYHALAKATDELQAYYEREEQHNDDCAEIR